MAIRSGNQAPRSSLPLLTFAFDPNDRTHALSVHCSEYVEFDSMRAARGTCMIRLGVDSVNQHIVCNVQLAKTLYSYLATYTRLVS